MDFCEWKIDGLFLLKTHKILALNSNKFKTDFFQEEEKMNKKTIDIIVNEFKLKYKIERKI